VCSEGKGTLLFEFEQVEGGDGYAEQAKLACGSRASSPGFCEKGGIEEALPRRSDDEDANFLEGKA